MNPINVLMEPGTITKTGTLTTTFHMPDEEANPPVWFGYGPLTIFNHTQGNVSGSMDTYPINTIHTSKNKQKKD